MKQQLMGSVDFEGALDTAGPASIVAEPRDGQALRFGDYRVLCRSRTLMRHDRVVPLGSRAFDLLVVLLRSRGELVSKEEIVREVWPSTFVDESNLRFQMGVLRKALGSERDWIKTIPGRGYLFVDESGQALSSVVAMSDHPSAGAGTAASRQSVILIVQPDADERDAMAMLLRALKVNVLSFTSVDEVAAFAGSPMQLAAN